MTIINTSTDRIAWAMLFVLIAVSQKLARSANILFPYWPLTRLMIMRYMNFKMVRLDKLQTQAEVFIW